MDRASWRSWPRKGFPRVWSWESCSRRLMAVHPRFRIPSECPGVKRDIGSSKPHAKMVQTRLARKRGLPASTFDTDVLSVVLNHVNVHDPSAESVDGALPRQLVGRQMDPRQGPSRRCGSEDDIRDERCGPQGSSCGSPRGSSYVRLLRDIRRVCCADE